MKKLKYNAGFTLLEALMAAMLIGLAIAALAASSGAFTAYNAAGVDLSTAEFLIEEVREMTAPVEFADLDDYAVTYTPPVDAGGAEMLEFTAYAQQITVQYANPADLTQASVAATDLRRITVAILKNNQEITRSSWVRANY